MSGVDTDDVVVITGATSGIGRATARKFGEDGARVGLLARGEDGQHRRGLVVVLTVFGVMLTWLGWDELE